eukprot:Filipodium_phascolosomae@DN2511_c0_g2_i3.p1
MCSWTAMKALADTAIAGLKSSDINVCFCYDHEEVGSQTLVGARSNLTQSMFSRILRSFNCDADDIARVFANSFLVSADMAHAVHPNYPSKTQTEHKFGLNAGIVVKHSPNMSYATAEEYTSV